MIQPKIYDQDATYQKYVNSVKPMEDIPEHQLIGLKRNLISILAMTSFDIRKNRDRIALIQMVESEVIADLLMSEKPFPLNYQN